MNYNQDQDLLFLKEKIREIKIALFKSEINSELRLPNNIIQTLSVEDDGTIWFFTTCNGNHARFIDKPFYAYLDYYKKDTGCSLHLAGKAIIADNEQEDQFATRNFTSAYTNVLVKMKIMQADFFEGKPYSNLSWTDKIKTVINNLFLPPEHKVYNFS